MNKTIKQPTEKYYLIPITSSKIKVNGISLESILKVSFPTIYSLEQQREEMKNKPKQPLDREKDLKEITFNLVLERNKLEIPSFLIATGNDKKLQEIYTKAVITTDNKEYFKDREVPLERVREYLNQSYPEKIKKFLDTGLYLRIVRKATDPQEKVTSINHPLLDELVEKQKIVLKKSKLTKVKEKILSLLRK